MIKQIEKGFQLRLTNGQASKDIQNKAAINSRCKAIERRKLDFRVQKYNIILNTTKYTLVM